MKGTFEYICTCNRKDTKKTRNKWVYQILLSQESPVLDSRE